MKGSAAVSDSPRLLVFKMKPLALAQDVLSVELAVGIAHLTDRTLVLYGGADMATAPGAARSHARHGVLDLLDDLPVPTLSYGEFRTRFASAGLPAFDPGLPLGRAVFAERSATRDATDIAAFAGSRTIFGDCDQDILHLKDSNLGYYSRLFYAPRAPFYAAMDRVCARGSYRDLAATISAGLGRFHGVHLRVDDFRRFMPYRGLDHAKEILRTLEANLSVDELLVIATDEPQNHEFFAPITARFRRHVFVDNLIASDHAAAFRALPHAGEAVLAWLGNLVLGGASEFLGMPGSAYSGLIQRRVAAAQAKRDLFSSSRPFKFTYPGYATMEVPFEGGVYLETRPGRYSWSRLGWDRDEAFLSGYREWPEALPERRQEHAEAAAPSPAPPRFTMSTSYTSANWPPKSAAADPAAARRAVEQQMQAIACDLMFGADRASLVQRIVALGAPAADAARIVDSAYNDPLIANGRAMASVLRRRDWLLESLERQQRLWPPAAAVERRSGVSADEFLERYYSRGRPLILTGEMQAWAAPASWSPSHLRAAAGDVEITCQSASGGRAAAADPSRRMPFARFLELASRAGERDAPYLVADENLHNPELARRLRPDHGTLERLLDARSAQAGGMLWIGASNALTPFHHDLVNCLVAQIAGRNRFKIVAAGDVAKLHNHLNVLSEIEDLEAALADAARFPTLAEVRIHDVALAPGEILYLPLAWWYQVRSEGFAISATYTDFKWPNDLYRAYPAR